jgi:hypothetical protein
MERYTHVVRECPAMIFHGTRCGTKEANRFGGKENQGMFVRVGGGGGGGGGAYHGISPHLA